MKSFKHQIIIALSVFTIGLLSLSLYNWHKDNFVYLPNVSTVEEGNGITTLYMTTGDVYVIDN